MKKMSTYRLSLLVNVEVEVEALSEEMAWYRLGQRIESDNAFDRLEEVASVEFVKFGPCVEITLPDRLPDK